MSDAPLIQPYGDTNAHIYDEKYLRSRIRLARQICVDLSQVQYWMPFDLLNLSNELLWMSNFYASTLSPNDANALELVAQISQDELTRRDRLVWDKGYKPTVAGYVYVLSSPFNYFKIGCSSKPRNRMLTFGVQLPFEVEMVAAIYSNDMYALEKELHQRFSDRRTRGEWFELTDADVEYIKGLAT